MNFDIIHDYPRLSPFGRIAFDLFGTPHIGGYIRGLYLKKSLGRIDRKNRILDIGCGGGGYDFYIKDRYPGSKVDAIDIDRKSIDRNKRMARKLGLKVNFMIKDATKMTFKDEYDIAISIDSLEHIKNIGQAVKNINSALKQGGIAIIHLPQKNWWEVNFYNKNFFSQHNRFIEKEHPSAKYSIEGFVGLLGKSGFRVIKARKSFGFFGKFSWETNQLLQERNMGRLRIVLLPLLKLLCILDYYAPNKSGSGIFAIAQKR